MSKVLEADDPNANLEGPNGELFRQKDGRVELPDGYERFADRAAAPRTLFKHYRKRFSGFDANELEARYKEWENGRLHNDAAQAEHRNASNPGLD